MNESPEDFLARMPDQLRIDVGDARLIHILKNALRLREAMLAGIMMAMVPPGSSEYVLLEEHGNNINLELGKPIDNRATQLIETLGPQMPKKLRKLYMGIIRVISDEMAKKISEAWAEVE
jgi:hypothetical protein